MLLTAKTIVVGDGKSIFHGYGILVEHGILEKIAPLDALKQKYPNEIVQDYGNATIMPGLIDMHIHLGHSWIYQEDSVHYDGNMIAYYALRNAQRALTKGVTTVRDVGSERRVCEKLRYASRKGWFKTPRIIHCNAGLSMTNGHMDIIGYYPRNRYHDPSAYRTVDGIWDMRKAVREMIQEGADWIKLTVSHRDALPEFTMEELVAGVDEAHRLGKKCAVHAGLNPGIDMAINAGFDTIEHGTFLTEPQVEKMIGNGQAWVPTIMAYTFAYDQVKDEYYSTGKISDPVLSKSMGNFGYFERAALAYRDNFKKYYNMGVMVVAGTDMVLATSPAAPVAQELAYMVRYGLTPVQTIQIATENAAKVLGLEDQIGTLVNGKAADILVCEGDATADIQCLQAVREVFIQGESVYTPNDFLPNKYSEAFSTPNFRR